MLFLSKLIPALLFPLGLVILLCLFALWLALRRGARVMALVLFLATAVLYTASCPLVSNHLLLGLEVRNRPALTYPKAQAIVLLGGSMMPATGPRLWPETGEAGDRVMHAARLWRQHRAPRLFVTGGFIPFLSGSRGTEASLYAALLTELFDVPDSLIERVGESRTTLEDAELTRARMDSLGLKKEILLVTSASHMPRAAAIFRKHGFIVHPAPTDFNADEDEAFLPFKLLPTAGAMEQTYVALHEYLGLWAYRMMGRI